MSVSVPDGQIRAMNPGFDGMEQVFALVPRPSGAWDRVDLSYTSSGTTAAMNTGPGNGRYSYVPSDHHETVIALVDIKTIRREGIAFGIDTNVGTLWLQAAGKNWTP